MDTALEAVATLHTNVGLILLYNIIIIIIITRTMFMVLSS